MNALKKAVLLALLYSRPGLALPALSYAGEPPSGAWALGLLAASATWELRRLDSAIDQVCWLLVSLAKLAQLGFSCQPGWTRG